MRTPFPKLFSFTITKNLSFYTIAILQIFPGQKSTNRLCLTSSLCCTNSLSFGLLSCSGVCLDGLKLSVNYIIVNKTKIVQWRLLNMDCLPIQRFSKANHCVPIQRYLSLLIALSRDLLGRKHSQCISRCVKMYHNVLQCWVIMTGSQAN